MTATALRILDGELVLARVTGPTPEGPFTAGACSFTESDASTRAAGELAERTTLLTEGPRRVVSTAEAHAQGGKMLEVITAGTAATEWLRAEALDCGEPVWLPADLVLVRWQGSRDLPVQQSSAGSAAHPNRNQAVDNGVRECLERYAVRRVWSGTTHLIPVTEQVPDAVPAGLLRAMHRHGLSAHAWIVGVTLPAAVVVVMVASAQGRVTFGSSCARTVRESVRHALCEAISVRAAFADSARLKRNFAMPDERVDQALRTASFQDAFQAFLRRLERAADGDLAGVGGVDVAAQVIRELHVTPVVVDLGRSAGLHVVKVVVPVPEFFVRRRHSDYVLAPGYLE